MKNNKGITLIALVITIIVLLILAGVAIAMLSGENGVLTKASKSAAETRIAEAKETAQLDVNTKMADYYEAKYVETTDTSKYANFGAYLTENAMTSTNAGLYTVTGTTITITPKTDKGKTITGTIGENGGITWQDPA